MLQADRIRNITCQKIGFHYVAYLNVSFVHTRHCNDDVRISDEVVVVDDGYSMFTIRFRLIPSIWQASVSRPAGQFRIISYFMNDEEETDGDCFQFECNTSDASAMDKSKAKGHWAYTYSVHTT